MIEKNDFITIKESKLEKESSFTKIKVKGGCVINVKSNFNNTVDLIEALKQGVFLSIQSEQ
ncbi:MAG: hypothetical protein PUB42_05980 [Firmicutes bacterium]|nr:hypothetical protein [Bacillota bacterium]